MSDYKSRNVERNFEMSSYSHESGRLLVACLMVTMIASSGCTTSTMRSYFASIDLDSTDPKGPEISFYRVSVRGSSFLVKSSFQSGFYDAEALHVLFGEVKKPEPAPAGRAGVLELTYNATKRTWESLNDKDRFTIVYGTNADAIAQQIQLFADSADAGKQIGALLSAAATGDALTGAIAEEQTSADLAIKAKDLAQKLRALSGTLADATKVNSAAALRSILLKAAQEASERLGSSTKFDAADLDTGFAQAAATYGALSK